MADSLETEVTPAPKSSKGVLIMAVCAAICVGAAGGMFVMMQKSGGGAAPHAAHAEGGGEGGGKAGEEAASDGEAEGGEGPVVTMNPFVVNLSDETGEPHYLKCTIAVELTGGSYEKVFEARTPKVRNAILMYLSNLRTMDIQGVQNKRSMLDHLRADVQEIVGKRGVRDIYLTEFVIQ